MGLSEASRLNFPTVPGLQWMMAMAALLDRDRRGLVKLMLKMPALRGKLQILSAMNPDFLSLCGAFEDASSTLERLRKENQSTDRARIAEYELLCCEIENEILEICIN